jgi:hypothetical protein
MRKTLSPLTRLGSFSILSRGLRFARRPWLHSFRHYAAENKKNKKLNGMGECAGAPGPLRGKLH